MYNVLFQSCIILSFVFSNYSIIIKIIYDILYAHYLTTAHYFIPYSHDPFYSKPKEIIHYINRDENGGEFTVSSNFSSPVWGRLYKALNNILIIGFIKLVADLYHAVMTEL
jgi:hypothetical protein